MNKDFSKNLDELLSSSLGSSESEGLLQSILQNSKEIILGLSSEEEILAASLGVKDNLGYEPLEIIGQNLSLILNDSASWQEYFQALSQKERVEGELGFKHKEGQEVKCSLVLSRWKNKEDGYILLAVDMSEYTKFQEDLVKVDRLAEMGRLAAGIVHDLKNPLSIINQAAGWAKVVVSDAKELKESDSQELLQTLQEIEDQTSRSKKITNQVLDFVRETRTDEKSFDLVELVNSTLKYIEPELKFPPIEVNTSFSAEKLLMESDYRLLQQVLVNLLSNAIYAVREKHKSAGKIDITIQCDKGCRIFVQDNGPGIPEETRKDIFKLFYTTKPIGKGTGLGLPICKNIMEKLGGSLDFKTEVDKGTTLIMSLPAEK